MISISMFYVCHPSGDESYKNYNYRSLVTIFESDHHRMARRPLHKLAIHLAPAVLHYSRHADHENYIHASHTHKSHTNHTCSCKNKFKCFRRLNLNVESQKTPPSKPNLANLNLAKMAKQFNFMCKIFCRWIFILNHFNPISYANVMAVLPNNIFL